MTSCVSHCSPFVAVFVERIRAKPVLKRFQHTGYFPKLFPGRIAVGGQCVIVDGERAFFAIGLLPAGLIWFIRRLVPESEAFTQASHQPRHFDLREIFRGEHRRVTLIGTVLASGIFGGAYIMITWLPTYMRMVLNLPVTSTSGYLAVNIIGSLLGPFIYGRLSDHISRGKAFMLFLLCQACVVAVYT
ncbi:MAG: MFS transporter, partial [Cytophagaceae bacterium]